MLISSVKYFIINNIRKDNLEFFDLNLWPVGVNDDSTLVSQLRPVSQYFLNLQPINQSSTFYVYWKFPSCQSQKSHTHTKLINWNSLQYCEFDLAHLCYTVVSLIFLYFLKCHYYKSVLTPILTSENTNYKFTLSNVNECWQDVFIIFMPI